MRALLTCLMIACSGPAQAMIWDGQDDWIGELAPIHIYTNAVPHALTLPQPPIRCPVDGQNGAASPYAQIPFGGPDCRASVEEREVGR